jgi:SAM-dependent MidA family methyltransferase
MERFDDYMERCLYGPDGFYATTGTAGRRRGDFLTSPEVGPLFGAVLTRALGACWERLGRPDGFTVHDVGCGPGTLLRTVAAALADGRRPPAWNLVGVDRVATDGAATDGLPDDLTGSVVVANELLDNVPFRVVERGADGALAEVHVAGGADEAGGSATGVERLEPSDLEPVGPLDLPVGTRAPVLERARTWVADVLARNPAQLLVFDYGAPTTVELAVRGGWLRTYRSHQRGDDPLDDPGGWDITTDVAWDQLPPADRLETQADFLRRWGIDELVEEGRRHWQANAARPDVRALRMRSRVVEVGALTDPAGLGGWWVASWGDPGRSIPARVDP